MYAFDIIIKNTNPKYKSWVDDCSSYVHFLERTGQVSQREHMIILRGDTIRIPVFCPELNSLSSKYCSPYNLKIMSNIEKNGCIIEHVQTGVDADNTDKDIARNPSFYILRAGWSSPLLCGDSHTPIPLYKIPPTDHSGDDYDNIVFWHKDYERIYGLWINSVYERFAEGELQNPYSKINTTGREICGLIEKLTGVPTYYFLLNYRDITVEEDAQRKCPITGNDWRIAGKTSDDIIAFKCEESRLVSELSANSGGGQQ